MASRVPIVAIVGRTNVGKSSLFNALAGRKIAIVEDIPGVTRDRCYALVKRHGFPFSLVDTGGLVGEEDAEFSESVRGQTELAIAEADLILAVVDGLCGVHPLDAEVVSYLRQSNKKVIWVVNKCEKPSTEQESSEFFSLGIEQYLCVSAAHNSGMRELVELIRDELGSEVGVLPLDDGAIRVAVIGKPNVGKSTLLNKILGDQRMISSPTPGTTRDSIDVEIVRDGQKFIMVDTAGLRKKPKIDKGSIERFGALRTLKSLAQCDVAILVIDGSEGPPKEQDAKIAGLIHDKGIPLLIAVNKWDIVEKDHKTSKQFEIDVYDQVKFARYAPVVFISALTGKRCPTILQKAKELYDNARVRVKTSELNRILSKAFIRRPPPVYRGEPIKLFFATQVDVAPPSIVLFVNHPKRLPFSYQRYLKNALRKEYPFVGSNIKLTFQKRREKDRRLDELSDAANV